MNFYNSISTASWIGIGIYVVYKTNKRRVLASLCTVKAIGDDMGGYVKKKYKNCLVKVTEEDINESK
tara:strand:- start:411 stop:611 length:201 start_codon:yes stop_codon:yes gene_type:complete